MGYTKVSVDPGLTIVGQQFQAVGGGPLDIQTITGENLVDGGVDTLRIWDGSAYSDYYYFTADDDINGDGTAAWGNEDWEPVEVDIPAGTGMWLNSQNEASLTFAGEVAGNTLEFSTGLNLIIPPQPLELNIQDIQGEGLVDGGMDTLRIWDGSAYSDYYYFTADDDIKGDGTAAWGNEDWEPVEVTIPVGAGMWLNAQNSGTLTFPNALAN